MGWEALTKLGEFLERGSVFGKEELIELTLLICARQKELGKLAIWIHADQEVNPLSIEIFDDEYGVLSAIDLQEEMLGVFAEDSDQVSQEFVQFDDEDGTAQYEAYFPTEDVDLSVWIDEIKVVIHPALYSYKPLTKFEENLKQFCAAALS